MFKYSTTRTATCPWSSTARVFQVGVLELAVLFDEWQIETALLSICRTLSTQAQAELAGKSKLFTVTS